MTLETTAATPRKRSRISAGLMLAAAALWLAGVAAGVAGMQHAGIALRVTGLVLCAGASLRRSSLLFWTLFAMPAGVELGLDAPHLAMQTRLLGDLFLRLIRMIVAPLLFATITTGIAGHGQLRSIGRVALKALIYFEVVTTLGLMIGAAAMYMSGAGWGVVLPAATAAAPAAQHVQGWQQVLLNMFPENIAQAVAQNQILQVAVFSVLFATALAMLPESKRSPLLTLLQSLADVMFQLTRIVMLLAPLAAGAALAYTVSGAGLATLLPLVKFGVTFYLALIAFTVLVQIPTLLLFRIPLRGFIDAVAEPASIGFATTTSEAALPLAMERMEEFGVPRWIVSFVIPTGYSFNLTGSSVYLSMAAVFCTQAAGIHLSLGQLVSMLAILMLASKGVAGVPRAVLVVLLATASAIQIPTTPILLILGIDTVLDMGRTLMNVVGNCMASAVIARSENALGDL
ncbi:MAG TPA: cation:dicarboxylase symporter family transporter [Terracidiphilus sp.]|jgi:proton glutamate symport protein|nr:cation:dicarboxylase symporter family transporter [Terracidiphilus sp.]